MVNKENKYVPGVYKNPSNYETIKVYVVDSGDPYDASILGIFQDKRKAELYAEIHNCVVTEFETADDEEIVFGWKVSVIHTNRDFSDMTIEVVEKPSYETILTCSNMEEAEEAVNNYEGDGEVYISL